MKRVQLTIHPADLDLPLTFEETTSGSKQFAHVEVVNWNVTPPPAAFLLRVRGDGARFETLLDTDPDIDEYALIPVTDDEWYCFVTGHGTDDARSLWETFSRGTLMTIPPAEWNADGSYTFTIVGRDEDVQAAVDDAPAAVQIDIDAVGGTTVTTDAVVASLSDRQREAVQTAIDLGYYDRPRQATSADLADALGCGKSTAAEHLRKAESTIVCQLFDA